MNLEKVSKVKTLAIHQICYDLLWIDHLISFLSILKSQTLNLEVYTLWDVFVLMYVSIILCWIISVSPEVLKLDVAHCTTAIIIRTIHVSKE